MQSAEFLTELQHLWHALAANPRNRAPVIARLLVNHAPDDAAAIQRYVDLISQATPPSNERDDALRLLKPNPILAHIQIVEKPERLLRVDPEIGRLCIALDCAAELRLWVVGRELSRQAGGSGVISRKALRNRLAASGVRCTPRHFNRLLAQGAGYFWRLEGKQIYLRAGIKLAPDLVMQALEKGIALGGNLPGVREVYLDVSGTIEGWEAMVYAGWLAHRGYKHDPTIARATLSQLFNRHPNTMRRWEADRLAAIVSKRHNFAQCADPERYFPFLPSYSQAYVAHIRFKGQVRQEVRLRWQLPNTYHSEINAHVHRGQASKIRRAVNAVFPAPEKRGGPLPLYLPTPEKLKRLYRSLKFRLGLLGDVNRPVYLYLGDHCRTGQGMFEITNTGFWFTHPNERASMIDEYVYFAALEQRMRSKIGTKL